MKKEITIALTTLLLITTPVFAESAHTNQGIDKSNSEVAQTNHDTDNTNNGKPQNTILAIPDKNDPDDHRVIPTIEPTSTQTVTPTISITPCEVNEDSENHGALVSCIAHLHRGGKTVSDEARSKDTDGDKDDHLSKTPTPTISITPSISPNESPIPTVSISPASISSTSGALDDDMFHFKSFGKFISQFISFFGHML